MTPPGNLHRAGGNRHGKRFSPSSEEDEEEGSCPGCGSLWPREGDNDAGPRQMLRGRSCRGSASGIGRAGAGDPAKGGTAADVPMSTAPGCGGRSPGADGGCRKAWDFTWLCKLLPVSTPHVTKPLPNISKLLRCC